MGRRSRIVSTAMLDAYGPLDCRLVLASRSQLRHVLQSGGQRLQHITSLQLLEQPEFACGAEYLSAAVEQLSRLQALSLPLADNELPLLAPLSNSLTALDAHVHIALDHSGSTAIEGLARLTSLRSLNLSGTPPSGGGKLMSALSNLPHLLHLAWFADSGLGAWTPTWLAGVRSSLPQLTSLFLDHLAPSQRQWGARNAEDMIRALVGLRSLSLKVSTAVGGGAAASGMLAVLSQCTWLETMHLQLAVESWTPPPSLLQLSSLRLASLELSVERFCSPSDVAPLLRPLAALGGVTRLVLDNRCCQGLRAPQLPASLVELQLLGGWEAPALLAHLKGLPGLRVLGLHHDTPFGSNFWAAGAAEQLPALTQLTALAVTRALPARGLAAGLTGLTALRELRLVAVDGEDAEYDVSDSDLLSLAALRELTCLAFSRMQRVSPPGLLAMLEALPKLQRLELSGVLGSGAEGEELVEGLLPRVLPCLNHLQLLHVPLPGHVRDALLSAAEAHDCRCDLAV